MRKRNHVLLDLSPYVCLFDDCEPTQGAFRTSTEWIDHMQQEHMPQEWVCQAHGDEPQVFNLEDDYKSHAIIQHGESHNHVQGLALINSRRVTTIFQTCPICGAIPKELANVSISLAEHQQSLQRHVGQHMQVLALLSLPRDHSDPETSSAGDHGHEDHSKKTSTTDHPDRDPHGQLDIAPGFEAYDFMNVSSEVTVEVVDGRQCTILPPNSPLPTTVDPLWFIDGRKMIGLSSSTKRS